MPLTFPQYNGKGISSFSFSSSSSLLYHRKIRTGVEEVPLDLSPLDGEEASCYAGGAVSVSEPTSVLDAFRTPSPLTTSSISSTLSSSHAGNSGVGGGGTSTAISGDATTVEKCGLMGVENWEQVSTDEHEHEHEHEQEHEHELEQEQSILRLIMGDAEDPSLDLNNILQTSSLPADSHFRTLGFGVLDTGFGLDQVPDALCSSGYAGHVPPSTSHALLTSAPPLFQPQETAATLEDKPNLMIHQSQTHFTQNPAMFMPLPYGHFEDQHLELEATPPPAKRLNPGPVASQQGIIEQLFKAAEVIENGGDTGLAQGILARLNQHLSSPIGNPFQRASFYFKEALHKLLLNVNVNANANASHSHHPFSSYSLIFKIGAYKSFSEISPVLQFANFTSNQALLESFHPFHRLHIIDFDIGYGGQWASLMQELVLRDNGTPSLKLTVFAHDDLELRFTLDNLKHFASEIKISFEIELLSLDLLASLSWPSSPEKEAVAINLSVAAFSNIPSYLPLVLRFVKHLSPTIIVCSDRGCERTDLSFPQQLVHSLQSHTALLESLDAVNANLDAMQKIERFLIQPAIEKVVVDGRRASERGVMPWQAMFLQMGLSPVTHSNFTESQAECLVQRTPVRGFHVEKKHNSLLLCWQRRELVGVSAWRCRS